MADLFKRQAKLYAEARRSYPPQLFQFIALKTPEQELAWDVGTGNGHYESLGVQQKHLAGIYRNVIATDTSAEQLAFVQKLPNIRYQHTPTLLEEELTSIVAPHKTVDLVTVAQAFHWFDRPAFYQHVKLLLKRPNGVLAVWCYTEPRIDDLVDAVFWRCYAESEPFWDPARKIAQDECRTFELPFEPVGGTEHTGPFEFEAERMMDLDAYLTFIRTGSPYQTASQKGVELLREEVVEDFKQAWEGRIRRAVPSS